MFTLGYLLPKSLSFVKNRYALLVALGLLFTTALPVCGQTDRVRGGGREHDESEPSPASKPAEPAPVASAAKVLSVSGTVKNPLTGQPVGYATVRLEALNLEVAADANGNFTLQLGKAAVKSYPLRITASGFREESLAVIPPTKGITVFLFPENP